MNLFAVFRENVSPLLPMFHMPTLSQTYWDAIAAVGSLDKNTEALIFSIYYSAIISMPDAQCLATLGLARDAAAERYRFAVEQAMARADLLNTQSMVLLQALVLFLSALRNRDDSRTCWSLTVLAFHLARAMGLHRDGAAFSLPPLDTELRRRLWWHIVILDSRASDHQGFGPIAYHTASDTRPPLNVDDADLRADMTEPPRPRPDTAPTDMTFLLVRCEATRTASRIQLLSPDTQIMAQRAGGDAAGVTRERVAQVRDMVAVLRRRYVRDEDAVSSSPILIMSSLLARLITVHFWLMMYYPFMKLERPGANGGPGHVGAAAPAACGRGSGIDDGDLDPDTITASAGARAEITGMMMTRDELFSKSIETLQLSSQFLHNPILARFKWYSQTHVQWHVVAFVLSEICRRPPSPECDSAWECVTRMYHNWTMHDGVKRGLMWKSVQRLMVKARYVREMQQASGIGGGKLEGRRPGAAQDARQQSDRNPSAGDDSACLGMDFSLSWDIPGSWDSMTGLDDMACPDFEAGVLGAELDDPFLEMLNMPPIDVGTGNVFSVSGRAEGDLARDVASSSSRGLGWS